MNAYLQSIQCLLNSRLLCVPTVVGGRYEIKEKNQESYLLNSCNMADVLVVDMQKISGQWPCFHGTHNYAHRKCDKVLITWSYDKNAPVYILFEMKSEQSKGAWTQLQAGMAFCDFVHGMSRVNALSDWGQAIFGAVTVKHFPFVQKKFFTHPGQSANWEKVPSRGRCWRTTLMRQPNELRLKTLLTQLEGLA